MSVYRRPRNDEQLPRWFQHRTSDNWTAPSYVYSPVSIRALHCSGHIQHAALSHTQCTCTAWGCVDE
jgi:hypothetical protein